MPYLTRVGHIPLNKTGVGARGYHVYRRGKSVRVIWGAIEVERRQTVRICWARATAQRDYRYRTESAAADALQQIVEEKELKGYVRLGVGAKIHSRR